MIKNRLTLTGWARLKPFSLAPILFFAVTIAEPSLALAKKSAISDRIEPPMRSVGQLRLPSHLRLERINPAEIFNGATYGAINLSHSTEDAALNLYPTRVLPSLWRFCVAADADLKVTYELRAISGQPNCLTHPDHPESKIRVTARPTAPRIMDQNQQEKWLEGGAILDLDLSDLRVTGSHRGTLTVTIYQL